MASLRALQLDDPNSVGIVELIYSYPQHNPSREFVHGNDSEQSDLEEHSSYLEFEAGWTSVFFTSICT